MAIDIILLQRELAEDAGGVIMSGNGIRSLVGKYLEKCLDNRPLLCILAVIRASCSHELVINHGKSRRKCLTLSDVKVALSCSTPSLSILI